MSGIYDFKDIDKNTEHKVQGHESKGQNELTASPQD